MNCYPNPFRENTTIMFDVSVPGKYKIEVFNLMGKLVDTITDQSIEAGIFYIDWDGRNSNNSPLPGGVYIIRLSGEKQSCSARVIVLK
jgi:flagellar hook assembly protein FlgD